MSPTTFAAWRAPSVRSWYDPLLIGITGTDTGAGKTVFAAGLTAALLERGIRADALKLVATGVPPGTAGEDAELLGAAAERAPHECVLQTFAAARSPLAAAAAEGRMLDVDALIAEVERRANRTEALVVECVGGLLVPLTHQATVATVLRRLDARVVIVGRAGLGTINHCALTVDACRASGLRVLGVVLSDAYGVDTGFAAENAAQIEAQCEVRVLGVLPRATDPRDARALGTLVTEHVDVGAIVDGAAGGSADREQMVRADHSHVWHPFTQETEWRDEHPLVIRWGEGCWLVDEDGRRYLDGIGSLWANVHGHAHPVLDRALHEQAGRIAHSTFLGQTHEAGALLAAELAAVTPDGLERVFYSEAGAAAVEVALRVALLAQQRRGERQRTRFLSLEDAYHGDTAGAVSVGRSEPFHRGLDALLFEVLRAPSPYIAGEAQALQRVRDIIEQQGTTLAALVLEPRMQGAAGMLPHSDEWLREVVATARAAGLLVVCDEVATGFGRTGDLFASSGAGIAPDILVLGKGLTGGYLPLSATLVTNELYDLFTGAYVDHRTLYYGHTYSGNPLACAVARASLRLFDVEHTLDRARILAARLSSGLAEVAQLRTVYDVRQKGVMTGIELRQEDGRPFAPALRVGRAVALAARRRGVIVRPLGDVLVLNPPLAMHERDADLLLEGVSQAISDVSARTPVAV